jgi:hypothetical protein
VAARTQLEGGHGPPTAGPSTTALCREISTRPLYVGSNSGILHLKITYTPGHALPGLMQHVTKISSEEARIVGAWSDGIGGAFPLIKIAAPKGGSGKRRSRACSF